MNCPAIRNSRVFLGPGVSAAAASPRAVAGAHASIDQHDVAAQHGVVALPVLALFVDRVGQVPALGPNADGDAVILRPS